MARATLGVHVAEISESLSLSFSTRRQLRQPLSPCNCVFSSWLAVHTRLAKQLCHFPDLPRMLRMLTYAYSSNCFGHMMIINKHPVQRVGSQGYLRASKRSCTWSADLGRVLWFVGHWCQSGWGGNLSCKSFRVEILHNSVLMRNDLCQDVQCRHTN